MQERKENKHPLRSSSALDHWNAFEINLVEPVAVGLTLCLQLLFVQGCGQDDCGALDFKPLVDVGFMPNTVQVESARRYGWPVAIRDCLAEIELERVAF